MKKTDEDALLCDLAETYGVYSLDGLPLSTVARLASGLRDDARIIQILTGSKIDTKTTLLALSVDRLALLFWGMCQGGKSKYKPDSIYEVLIADHEKECIGFDSGEDFERAWREIMEG